ncbi:MAG: hypothetical protein LBN39_08260 [Planctomycetaceae bacterium]|jgi:hypothetical protein|nr:hypothetical protein [Planctomycetaceae bacterium]
MMMTNKQSVNQQDDILMTGEPGFVPSEKSVRSALERCRKWISEHPDDPEVPILRREYDECIKSRFPDLSPLPEEPQAAA